MRAARPKRKKTTNTRQIAFTRFMFIVAFLVIWMGGISARLVHLQVTKHDWLREKATGQRLDVKSSKQPRGTIFDRNGRALAMSVRVKTLYADPVEMPDPKASAKAIAKAIGTKEGDLAKQLSDAKQTERRFVPLLKGVDETTVQRINRELDDPSVRKADSPNFSGLHWREDQKRSYPYERMAAHVIGFSNADGVGQAGVEQSQNDVLYGAVIKRVQERDRLGRIYDETISEKEPPKDVVLTINASIQFMVEEALQRAVTASQARAGTAIVLDNATGEVLALANYPTFDPNRLIEITADNLSNAAVQQVYSPGSVFKLITYSSALERNMFTPDSQIDSGNGTVEVGGRRFSDSRAYGRISYTKAFAVSSNVCAIKTGLRVGREGFFKSITDFGFGRKTGIELPAETNGIVRNPERWYGDSLASMSIGYEIGVTPLQMTSAFAAIANDGVRVQPHIIKEIKGTAGNTLFVTQPEKTRVVSARTARDLRIMMKEVVQSGTGKLARLNGYSSAGKTGTAWKFDEKLKKVNSAKYVSSFIGIAPAERPVITIGVVIDEPKVGGRNGGQVAGPVFREIAERILPELNIAPNGETVPEGEVEDIPELTAAMDSFPAILGEREVNTAASVKLPESQKAKDRPTPATSSINTKPREKPERYEERSKAGVTHPTSVKKPETGVASRPRVVTLETQRPAAKEKAPQKIEKSITEKKKAKP